MAAYTHTHTYYHGPIGGPDLTTRWKTASAKTLLELLSNGSLTLAQIRAILKEGRLTRIQVRNAAWKAIKAVTDWQKQIALLRMYYPLVRPRG